MITLYCDADYVDIDYVMANWGVEIMNISAVSNTDGTVALTGKQGSTWSFTISIKQSDNITPMDLTGYSARGQIRKLHASTEITKTFVCTILSPPTNGIVSIGLSSVDSAAIVTGKSGKDAASTYVYDIEIYTGSAPEVVTRILEGKLFVDPEVTK